MVEKNEAGRIGKRIKEIRISKDMKLTEVSKNAGISKGLLSRIENERAIPSLPVMFSIIKALDESPATFFALMQKSDEYPYYHLIRKNEYQPAEKEDATGFHYYSVLTHLFSDITVNIAYLELESDAKRDLVTTDGMEYIFLVEGTIDYRICDDVFTMYEGDSLFFDGRSPHVKINQSGKTVGILVIYFLFNR